MEQSPPWLTKVLSEFNRHTTCRNEWELIDIAVDLHRQPDLPGHLEILFESLREGLGRSVLVGVNFLMLGYFDSVTEQQVNPRFYQAGTQALGLEERREEDHRAAEFAFAQAVTEDERGTHDSQSRLVVVQFPYFIRKLQVSDRSGDFTFQQFQALFETKQVLFTDPQIVATKEASQEWLRNHPENEYAQRFLFTLALRVHNGIENKLQLDEVQQSLAHLFGAFLTWAGMGVADSTRYMMAGIAARLAHFSHEFVKPFGEIRRLLTDRAAEMPSELVAQLEALLQKVELPDIRNLVGSRAVKGTPFTETLSRALARNTNHPRESALQNGLHTFVLTIDDEKGREFTLEIKDLPPPALQIDFEPTYMDRLIRNMLRNASQHNKSSSLSLQMSFTINSVSRFLTMTLRQNNSTIDSRVRRQLFRVPVLSKQSKGTGMGLWTVGMAFESERLPAPIVRQEGKDTVFQFLQDIFPLGASLRQF